ncbi:MAG: glycoside hydrolase family 127 protein [Promethearchaeota archaeon]
MNRFSNQLGLNQVQIDDPFWTPHLKINKEKAIFHQWNQLEKTRCIDNFRILAGEKDGFREGWFFSDSDAFKWLDAASRIYITSPSDKLKSILDDFIGLIQKSQESDGYIYTFNQIHFPNTRWTNLWIEHELYCLGHLIEALISYYEFSQDPKILEMTKKPADLLVHQFLKLNTSNNAIPGHQEIEISLIKLYRITKDKQYLELANEFIQRRGKSRFKWLLLLKQDISHNRRKKRVEKLKQNYLMDHPEDQDFQLPENVYTAFPSGVKRRVLYNYASGRYFQNHLPLEEQKTPEGHAVRFSYLMTAAAMYSYETDGKFIPTLQTIWDHMVRFRMFVTGGIGSLPRIEGFGHDYELDPEHAYCETCASLGSIFWNWQMTLLTQEAKFADLLEWQLYNAALVGLSQDGKSYLYKNPLASRGDLTRKEWFEIPCCPSNLTRTLAIISQYLYTYTSDTIWVNQFISSSGKISLNSNSPPINIKMRSNLPWEGTIKILLEIDSPLFFTLALRIPSWVDEYSVKINDQEQKSVNKETIHSETASGYSPFRSNYIFLKRKWKSRDEIEVYFPMKIRILNSHPNVKTCLGNSTITRGPLVYCLEEIDNPNFDIFRAKIMNNSLYVEPSELFNGICTIKGQTNEGSDVVTIPYYCWANRGSSQMTVKVNVIE